MVVLLLIPREWGITFGGRSVLELKAMSGFYHHFRVPLLVLVGLSVCLSCADSASAAEWLPLLLAQGGAAKTLLGYTLTLLGIALGLIVVCRPSKRASPDGDKKKGR